MKRFTLLILFSFCIGYAGVQALKLGNSKLKQESHNEQGGYIESCGDLPGLVGDDC